jgi:hypothetical protein
MIEDEKYKIINEVLMSRSLHHNCELKLKCSFWKSLVWNLLHHAHNGIRLNIFKISLEEN